MPTLATIAATFTLVLGLGTASAAPAPPVPPQTHTMQWSFEMGKGRLGAQVSSMTPELRRFFGAPEDAGILVQGTDDGSVAKAAGVAVGDVIVEVDGARIDGIADVREALSDRKKGDSVDVVVIRKQKRKKLTARMDDDPMPSGFAFGDPFGSHGFGGSSSTRDRLDEIERRLDALEGGKPPPKKRPGKPKKSAPKATPKRVPNGA